MTQTIEVDESAAGVVEALLAKRESLAVHYSACTGLGLDEAEAYTDERLRFLIAEMVPSP